MNIIWSDLAIEDLRDIEEYIARDNPDRATTSGTLKMIGVECADFRHTFSMSEIRRRYK